MKNKSAVIVIGIIFSTISAALAQTQTNEPPKPKWTGLLSAGVTLTRGNSDTSLATLTAKADRKAEDNEWHLGLSGAYGQSKVNGVSSTTAQSLDGFVQYNQLFTERFYGYARVEGLRDDVADIRYRVTLSPGAGYYFVKEKTVDLSGEFGPGYIFERLGTNDMNFATLRVAEKFHLQLSDRARCWQTVEWLPQVDDFGNYTINFEAGLEADLNSSKSLSLQFIFDDTYNHKPAAGRLKNDAKLIAAVAYKF